MNWSPPNPFHTEVDLLAPLDDEPRPQITTPITRNPDPKHVPRPHATLAYVDQLRQAKIKGNEGGNSRSAGAQVLATGPHENEDATAKTSRTAESEIIAQMRRCGLEPCLDQPINEKCTLPTFAINDRMRINYNGRRKMPVYFDEQYFKFKPAKKEASTDSTSSTDDIFDEPHERVFGVERGTFGDESGTFRGANGSYRVAGGLCYASNESFNPSSEPAVGSEGPTDTSRELSREIYDPSEVVYDQLGASKYRSRRTHDSPNDAYYPSKDSKYPSKGEFYSREVYYSNERNNSSKEAYQPKESYYSSREFHYPSRSSYRSALESFYPSSESNYPSSESYDRSNESFEVASSLGQSLNLDSSFTDEICSNAGYSGDNESFDGSTSNSSSLLSDENTVRAMLKGRRPNRGKVLVTNAMHYRRS